VQCKLEYSGKGYAMAMHEVPAERGRVDRMAFTAKTTRRTARVSGSLLPVCIFVI